MLCMGIHVELYPFSHQKLTLRDFHFYAKTFDGILCIFITKGTNVTVSFFKTDINPLYARKMPSCRKWFAIFI